MPKDYEAICSDHFQESDFEVKASGRRYVRKDAVPSKQGYPGGLKSLHDHNYAETIETEEIQYPPEIMMLLIFALLLFFAFLLTVPRPPPIPNEEKHDTGKI